MLAGRLLLYTEGQILLKLFPSAQSCRLFHEW